MIREYLLMARDIASHLVFGRCKRTQRSELLARHYERRTDFLTTRVKDLTKARELDAEAMRDLKARLETWANLDDALADVPDTVADLPRDMRRTT